LDIIYLDISLVEIEEITKSLIGKESLILENSLEKEDLFMDNDNFNLINKFIYTNEYKKILFEKHLNIKEKSDFNIYTDGSLKNAQNELCRMGIGWLIKEENRILESFNTKIINWPSSTKAKIVALLSALIVIPYSSSLKIYTDSKALIDGFNIHIIFNKPKSSKKIMKDNNSIY
jgi:hypothetical protein